MVEISVIIPTFNDWTRLRKCLDALSRQSIENEQVEVIVIDNSNEFDVPGYISESPLKVRYYHQSKPGSYAARNLGAEQAKGNILAFTDADCIPDEQWLLNASNHYRNSDCDLIGGNIQIFKAKEGSEYAFIYEKHTAFPQHSNVPKGKSVTANLFVKREIFERIGGFDSSMMSGGDWDFTLRCTENGYHMIYAENVLVLHPASKNLTRIIKKQYRLTCWGSINTRKKYGHSQIRILISHLLNGLKRVNGHQKLASTKKERLVIFSIDLLGYIFKSVVNVGILFHLIKPRKVRE